GLPLLEGEPPDRRAEPEREPMDVDPGPLGGEEVTELVHEDQHADRDDERQDSDSETAHPTSFSAASRAHRSAACTVSRSSTGATGCRARTASITSLIRPNGNRPSRNRATATSFAPLNTAGAVPPVRPASIPASNARNTSRRT